MARYEDEYPDNRGQRGSYDYREGRGERDAHGSRYDYDYDEGGVDKVSVVRRVNGIISLICGLFAAVLALHIILFVADANFANPFARFITDWANGVSLGLNNLFLWGPEKVQVALNHGVAALLWLLIGWLLTTVIARIVLPYPDRNWYRRR
ncbi:hypothetical protein [Haloechinothrix sp. LS1_15]|uniref:hypothetical protein n=1 Tax=Haloechinothrix sp. LS1_15 TaxID=2652248 RepID=UPI002946D743|nr:hypothetical protein [Haloechinothrix sp. LS1_15]MDV6014529.1 hypothetical protein [Haloechinothrix sp. LS1_15]